ncbi:MAG: hypothetical protein MO852_14175 [Candidatus Devosia euplotis]|nr:hypothetical protein [Candidatus Devosia euplotis]
MAPQPIGAQVLLIGGNEQAQVGADLEAGDQVEQRLVEGAVMAEPIAHRRH